MIVGASGIGAWAGGAVQELHWYRVWIASIATVAAISLLITADMRSLRTQLGGAAFLRSLALFNCRVAVVRVLPRGDARSLLVYVSVALVCDAYLLAIASNPSSRGLNLRHQFAVRSLSHSEFARKEIVVVNHTAIGCLGAMA